MKPAAKFRTETDTLGPVAVPSYAYYGAQTQRAVENFPVSGHRTHPPLIAAIIVIKKAAAIVHKELGLLKPEYADAIIRACDIVGAPMDIGDPKRFGTDYPPSHKATDGHGKFVPAAHFPIDIYQAGAGTSMHMNVNEVIANRANVILSAAKNPVGIHPNDHVNMAQSTNDVIPTALRIAVLRQLPALTDALQHLTKTLNKKTTQFSSVNKSGRTHLSDALPITLGNEFGAYAHVISSTQTAIQQSVAVLCVLGIGGTAVGSGANTHPKYRRMIIKQLKSLTGLPLRPSADLYTSMQSTADFLTVSAALRTLATELIRIGNDLRLLSSGPNTGFAEISLPAVQPGSSIMPGKVNPSIIEMLTMVCFQVIGYDHAIVLASQAGQLELNVMLPLIAYNLLEQIRILTNAMTVFTEKCVMGIGANEEMCRFWLERTNAIVTLLAPKIGYEKAAALFKEAQKRGISVKDVAREKGYVDL